MRVPAVVSWPGMIEPGRASDGLVHLLDLFATCLTMAGAGDRVPGDRYIDAVDQLSFLLAADDREVVSNRKYQHYWLTATYSALRVGEYKYLSSSISDDDTDVLNPGGFTGVVQRYGYGRLYNLYLDPKETRSYMIRKLVYIDAIISEVARHQRTFREWPNKPAPRQRPLRLSSGRARRPPCAGRLRKSGWAMSTRRWARSRTVRPVSSAAPYSVTTTPVWCRGVETTDPSGGRPAMRDTTSPARTAVERRQTSEWASRCSSAPGHEVLVAPDARDLPAVDGVGHHLAVEVDREGAVDGDEVGVARDDRRVVDRVDRQEGHLLVPVQPLVELGDPEGERRHRHAVEHPLGVVGDLAGLVQPHQAAGEHLGVDAETAERATGQLRRDDVGDGADARLQRGPVLHVGQRDAGDRFVRLVGRRLGEGEGGAVGLDQHVDRIEGNGVVVLRQQALGPGQVRVDLHHEQALRGPGRRGAVRPGCPPCGGRGSPLPPRAVPPAPSSPGARTWP